MQWARDKFAGYFSNAIEDANNWVSGDDFLARLKQVESFAAKKERLQSCLHVLQMNNYGKATFDTCVEWARLVFEDLFHNTIAQLLYNFPLDATTSTGTHAILSVYLIPLFWSASFRIEVCAGLVVMIL